MRRSILRWKMPTARDIMPATATDNNLGVAVDDHYSQPEPEIDQLLL
jgi:hypothetical protein